MPDNTNALRARGPSPLGIEPPPIGESSMAVSLRVGGLFAGIGGFEEGFRRHGHHAQFLCEQDATAKRVLRQHFPGVSLINDVREIESISECDVLTAGFPCTDLSQVGRTEGINGRESSLVREVFRLLIGASDRLKWLILENVPFMLHLHRGAAIRQITERLEQLGWKWAYRTLDSRAFGLPQRRRRIFLVASRTSDPRPVLLGQDAGASEPNSRGRHACGFYWTEGHRGLGWAIDAIPPLKGGSSVSIPSPPGIWFPGRRAFYLPSIQDAERLQGFASDWTRAAGDLPEEQRRRWKLVGNAVSVPVAAWLAERILAHGSYESAKDVELTPGQAWPDAAWGVDGRHGVSSVSTSPLGLPAAHLASFLENRLHPLSLRASAGFLARLEHSTLKFDASFASDLRQYVMREAKRMATKKVVVEDVTRISERLKRSRSDRRSSRRSTVDPAVSRRMAATRGRDNPGERALRSAIHKAGFRFRVHTKVLPGLQRTADLSFSSLHVAIFLDGCFWHGCPMHATWPKKDAAMWRAKIEANRARDRDTDRRLKEAGWLVIRIWAHERPDVAVRRITRTLRTRRESSRLKDP